MVSQSHHRAVIIFATLSFVFAIVSLSLFLTQGWANVVLSTKFSNPQISDSESLKVDQFFLGDSSLAGKSNVGNEKSGKDNDGSIVYGQSSQVKESLSARAYLVANVLTGHVYLEHNSYVSMPVASVSKLLTALVALNTYPANTNITITPEETRVPPDASNLTAGEKFSLKELLYPMLLSSSNIAAEAIASHEGRTKFLEAMSSDAWEIGMPSSYFADPSGVDPHNAASAWGIFALARYLYQFHPDILGLTRTNSVEIGTTTDHGAHDFDSIHPFVNDLRFIGGKTGRTPEAGETMLTILKIGGKPLAFIVLGSAYGQREKDTRLLIDKVSNIIGEK
jgi:serine-type D-Ala-D-Ala carboxypeptidase (penicillin-binding protein 5/6)